MALASSLQKATNKILKKFGGDITIKQTLLDAYDVENGTLIKNQKSVTIKGYLEGVTSREVNTSIAETDKKVMVAASALGFEPTTEDIVIVSSIQYKIIQVDKEEQNNIDILYTIYLRA